MKVFLRGTHYIKKNKTTAVTSVSELIIAKYFLITDALSEQFIEQRFCCCSISNVVIYCFYVLIFGGIY